MCQHALQLLILHLYNQESKTGGPVQHHLLPSRCAVRERSTYEMTAHVSAARQIAPITTFTTTQVLFLKAPLGCRTQWSSGSTWLQLSLWTFLEDLFLKYHTFELTALHCLLAILQGYARHYSALLSTATCA